MSAVRMRRCLFICAATILVLAVLPAQSADRAREVADYALLAEGEKLNEATQPAAALEIFERVAKEYPDTESGMFAQFRRAETLVFLGQCTEAIARARMVIDAYPNTSVAAWSQYAIGQALLKQQGQPGEAVRALRGVKSMLPNKLDLGALEGSRVVLARLIEQHYGFSEKMDPLAPASFLEVARNDSKGKAELYAILAFHWGRAGRIDLANPVLDRIAQECPEEKDELEWAKAEVGMGYLNGHSEGDEFCRLAIDLLNPVLSSSVPNDESAKAASALRGSTSEAASMPRPLECSKVR
jgi:tetratricopeptide (TPR) repeat protein